MILWPLYPRSPESKCIKGLLLDRSCLQDFSRQAFGLGGQPDPLAIIQEDAFVLLLLFLQDADLLFEVVDGLPMLFVDAVCQACHERKPEVLFRGSQRLFDQRVASNRFRRGTA